MRAQNCAALSAHLTKRMGLERRVAEPLKNDRFTGPQLVPPSSSGQKRRWRKPLLIVGLVVVGILVAGTAVVGSKWPFTPQHVTSDLEHASRTTVAFQHFHETFFPHPGCVLENVTFRNSRKPGSPPLLTVAKLTIAGSYSGLLREHVALIRAQGAHVVLPPLREGKTIFEAGSSTAHATIGEIVADGTILDITSAQRGTPPLRFQIRQLTIRNPGQPVMSFRVDAFNPKPTGELLLTGRMGHWNSEDAAATEFSGTYAFRHAQLGSFQGVAGTLSSDGTFQGPLNALSLRGSADVPNFEVTRSHHRIHLTTQFDAVVQGTTGDVHLRSIRGHWGRTTVTGTGNIEAKPGSKGKSAVFDFFVRDGRIEDVLGLFVHAPHSPLDGATNFEAKVSIPPGKKTFLEKIVLDGNFAITDGRFTSSKTQTSVDKLSAQARGQTDTKDVEDVFSDLRGHVLLSDGVAHFSTLHVRVPGAGARMHGTYGLENQRVNLHGMLFLQAKLSQATSGIKSILLKPLEPFLKKNRRGGAKFPVSITGTYSHPKYSTDPI